MPRSQKGPPDKGTAEKKNIEGIISVNRRGTGYVAFPLAEGALKPAAGAKKEREDIEIENNDLMGALNGDVVEVSLKGLFPRPKGSIVRVVRRAKETFV